MRYLVGFCIILVAIQFIRPARNIATAPQPNDVATRFSAPAEVRKNLEAACYDCHSNTTRYPWYANVQPVGWYLAKHVHDGKRHLNFSEFGALPPKVAKKKLEHVIRAFQKGFMPLSSYKLMHPESRLTEAQSREIVEWLEKVSQNYPADKAK